MNTSLDADSSRFLRALTALNTRIERRTAEIASGKRLRSPSDEPDDVSRLLTIRSETARLEQLKLNLSRHTTEVDTAEQALQAAAALMDRVLSIGAQGASGAQTPATREVLARELDTILNRMVAVANTEVDGRFLFAGDSDQTIPYRLDETADPPWGAFLGSASTRQALDPLGFSFSVALSAEEIFANLDVSKNVFQAIDSLRDALRAGDNAALRTVLDGLPAAAGHLNSQLGIYGAYQRQVREAVDTTARLQVRNKTELANLEDADVTEAIVELEQLRYQQEATLKVRASLPKTSLFDFIA
jgi:flagellar hook-associated protein 3 FlgL